MLKQGKTGVWSLVAISQLLLITQRTMTYQTGLELIDKSISGLIGEIYHFTITLKYSELCMPNFLHHTTASLGTSLVLTLIELGPLKTKFES